MEELQKTFLEWCETLPESLSWLDSQVAPQAAEDVFVEFLRQVSKATQLAEVNAAAGMALQDLKGIKG